MPRDYTHKGDAFTRKVQAGEGPRTVHILRNRWTGREYARRVSVLEVPALRVRELLGKLRQSGDGNHTADALEQQGARVYWQAWERLAVVLAEGQDLPEGTPDGGTFLEFRYVLRGRARADGSRARAVLFVCPYCSRDVAAVYCSRWRLDGSACVWVGDWRKEPGKDLESVTGGGLFGCVHCLGLTYPSSQEHGTPSGDGRLLHMGNPARWQKTRRGFAMERALFRVSKRFGLAFPGRLRD